MNDVVKLRALDAFNACELGMATVQPGAEFEAPPNVAADVVEKGLAEVVAVVVAVVPVVVEAKPPKVLHGKKPA